MTGPKVQVWRGLRTMLALSFRASPWRAVVALLLKTVVSVADVLFAYVIKLIVDAAVARDVTESLIAAGIMGAVAAAQATAGIAGFLIQVSLEERVGLLVDRRTIELAAGLPHVEHYERPEYLDELDMLRTNREQLTMSVGAIVQNIGIVIRLIGTAVLLVRLHPLLLLLPAFGLPSLWAGARAQQLVIRAEEKIAEPRRLARHYFDLATTAGPAKEMRIFGVGADIVRRHDDLLHTNDRIALGARVRGALLSGAGWFVFGVGYVGVLVFIVVRAVNGQATLGDVLLAATLAQQVNGQVSGAVQMVGWMLGTLKTVARYVWLNDYSAERRAILDDDDRAPLPERIARGVELSGVSFTYPGTGREILRDVSLQIPAGATVAVVGDNGAGKSTLVKLLCRMYDPTEGSILLDGVSLSRFDLEEFRARISAGFQDFARFELLAREAVGVGSLESIDDPAEVSAALARANASDVVATLARGLETQLGKSFDDGVDLSIGQWQKLALGRAMMREQPLLLVLDEPTASLDAQTEHALFERYAGAARAVSRASGAITILVSHRFSTVRMADLIVVVNEGGVAEAGTHAELMARGGLYAELYEIQARQYR